MQNDLLQKYHDIEERIESANRNGSISKETHKNLSLELATLFPYLNYALHKEILLSGEILSQKLDDIYARFKKILLKGYQT